jgi:hypothetical protein
MRRAVMELFELTVTALANSPQRAREASALFTVCSHRSISIAVMISIDISHHWQRRALMHMLMTAFDF